MADMDKDVGTLEKGNIYFLYRPRVQEESPDGIEDVERFYVVLSPDDRKVLRLLVLGRKKAPDAEQAAERTWGFVDMAARDAAELEPALGEVKYTTKTRGERTRPAARPAGEGRYRIVRHADHTHLVYALELPKEPGDVQRELNVEPEGSFIISIKNPQKPSPAQTGLRGRQRAELPRHLLEKFEGRRFCDADPPDFLDYPGTEFILIAAREGSEELGLEIKMDRENQHSADVIKELKLDRKEHPMEPLFAGKWA